MNNTYLDVISIIGRIHRQFLEVVKLELDGMGIYDINNVQAMMLFNIGEAEMTVGELTLRGCYLGSNVTYNVKAMVEQGYLTQQFRARPPISSHSTDRKREEVAGWADGGAQASCRHAAARRRNRRWPTECRDYASPPRTVLEPYSRLSATVAGRRLTLHPVRRGPQNRPQ
jgi:hypothetical protein